MPHLGISFEEKRVERVEALKDELKLESLPIPNVSYYQTIEEQNQFLNSISNTQFGKNLLKLQNRLNEEMGIPLILPKLSNITNISVLQQQFLAMQGIGLGKDRQGNYGAEIQGTARAFQNIAQTNGKAGSFFLPGGLGYQEVVKQKKPSKSIPTTSNRRSYCRCTRRNNTR